MDNEHYEELTAEGATARNIGRRLGSAHDGNSAGFDFSDDEAVIVAGSALQKAAWPLERNSPRAPAILHGLCEAARPAFWAGSSPICCLPWTVGDGASGRWFIVSLDFDLDEIFISALALGINFAGVAIGQSESAREMTSSLLPSALRSCRYSKCACSIPCSNPFVIV